MQLPAEHEETFGYAEVEGEKSLMGQESISFLFSFTFYWFLIEHEDKCISNNPIRGYLKSGLIVEMYVIIFASFQ